MTDQRQKIAALIDAHIAGRPNTNEQASSLVQSKTVDLLSPVSESDNHAAAPPPTTLTPIDPPPQMPVTTPGPFQVRPTTPSPATTIPPPPTPDNVNIPVRESFGESGGIVSAWTEKFSHGEGDRNQIMRDLVELVDMGTVPDWLAQRYAATSFAEHEADGSVGIAFGPDTGFIQFLNDTVPNSGNELMKIWDAEHYGIAGDDHNG